MDRPTPGEQVWARNAFRKDVLWPVGVCAVGGERDGEWRIRESRPGGSCPATLALACACSEGLIRVLSAWLVSQAIIVDPERDAPESVQKNAVTGRVCVMYYGPSTALVGVGFGRHGIVAPSSAAASLSFPVGCARSDPGRAAGSSLGNLWTEICPLFCCGVCVPTDAPARLVLADGGGHPALAGALRGVAGAPEAAASTAKVVASFPAQPPPPPAGREVCPSRHEGASRPPPYARPFTAVDNRPPAPTLTDELKRWGLSARAPEPRACAASNRALFLCQSVAANVGTAPLDPSSFSDAHLNALPCACS